MESLQHTGAKCTEGVWTLVCYGYKENNSQWNTITPKKDEKMLLILKQMSLKILNGNELVETFSFLWHDIKRIVHDKDTMAMVIEQQAVKKRFLRLRFAGGMLYSGEQFCNQCAETLNYYVITKPVNQDDQAGEPEKSSLSQYVSEFIKNSNGLPSQTFKEFESMYPLEDIIDECILDVNFPDLVVKVRDILEAKMNRK